MRSLYAELRAVEPAVEGAGDGSRRAAVAAWMARLTDHLTAGALSYDEYVWSL